MRRGFHSGRVGKDVHLDLGGKLLFALIEAVGQVLQQTAFDCWIESGKSSDLTGALAEAGTKFSDDGGIAGCGHCGLLALEVLQVLDSHF